MSQGGFLLFSREFVKGFRFFFLKILFHCRCETFAPATNLGFGFHGVLI
jgi:hypothetical protein